MIVALAMAAHAAVQGQSESGYDTTYSGFNDDDDMSWQELRFNLYVRSGGRIVLP